jgi:glycerol-3-phosphate acyltransferase PlsY
MPRLHRFQYSIGTIMAEILLIVVAYLVGSLPFVYLLGRLRGYDLRKEDDMHLSMWRKVGRVEGATAIMWEVLKGAGVVLVARSLGFETWAVACAGVVAVGGQMWSVFLGFSGEKGNSTGVGMVAALAPVAFLFGLVPILTGVTVKAAASLRDRNKSVKERWDFAGSATLAMPLGMLGGFAVFPIATCALGLSGWISASLLALVLLILVKRVTDGLAADLKTAENRTSVVVNRLLYDRSYK